MRKFSRPVRRCGAIAICVLWFSVVSSAAAQDYLPPGGGPEGPFNRFVNLAAVKPGELIVKVTPKSRKKVAKQLKRKHPRKAAPTTRQVNNEIARILGLRTSKPLVGESLLVKGTGPNLNKINSAIKAGLVTRVQRNMKIFAFNTPNDLLYAFGLQYGLNNTGFLGAVPDVDVDAPEAWTITTGSPDVVVAIIDTGIALSHPDLKNNLWVNDREIPGNNIDDDRNGYIDDIHGANFLTDSGNPNDDNLHGTHVAGIVAAECFNSRGVCGVAPSVKLMALKLLDAQGSGDGAGLLKALRYAIDMKRRGVNLKVLNMSFGGNETLDEVLELFEEARRAGILIVTAAGNDSSDNDALPVYPANYRLSNLLSVAAINDLGQLAYFSNYGAQYVDVGAPGASIWSTFLFGFYFPLDGTSMAAPFVSGIGALIASRYPHYTPAQIRQKIVTSVKPYRHLQGRIVHPGMVSAYLAVN